MKLKNSIESLLFISHKPLSLKELAKVTSSNQKEVESAIIELENYYSKRDSGIMMLNVDSKYQLVTSDDSSEVVKKFIKSEVTGELTKPALETLTIIAYRAPISKAELELIRGVNCSVILRNLLMRGLIEAKEEKKRMIVLYNITFEFLKYLGISQASELLDFEKLNRSNNLEKLLIETSETDADNAESVVVSEDL